MRLWILICALAPSVAVAQAPTIGAGRALDAPAEGRARPRSDVPELGDLDAARRYLELTIRPRDPHRYALLDAELARLETMNEVAAGVAWTALGTAAATVAIAVGLAADAQQEPSAVLFVVGGGVLLAGLLVQAILRPSREAILDVFRVRR